MGSVCPRVELNRSGSQCAGWWSFAHRRAEISNRSSVGKSGSCSYGCRDVLQSVCGAAVLECGGEIGDRDGKATVERSSGSLLIPALPVFPPHRHPLRLPTQGILLDWAARPAWGSLIGICDPRAGRLSPYSPAMKPVDCHLPYSSSRVCPVKGTWPRLALGLPWSLPHLKLLLGVRGHVGSVTWVYARWFAQESQTQQSHWLLFLRSGLKDKTVSVTGHQRHAISNWLGPSLTRTSPGILALPYPLHQACFFGRQHPPGAGLHEIHYPLWFFCPSTSLSESLIPITPSHVGTSPTECPQGRSRASTNIWETGWALRAEGARGVYSASSMNLLGV